MNASQTTPRDPKNNPGNALPRWLHRLALKAKGHARPAGVLYSHNQLRNMLRAAGYDQINSYWSSPEMRFPTHQTPTDAPSIRRVRKQPGFVQGNFRSTAMLMPWIPASIVKHVTPGLTFIAHKP